MVWVLSRVNLNSQTITLCMHTCMYAIYVHYVHVPVHVMCTFMFVCVCVCKFFGNGETLYVHNLCTVRTCTWCTFIFVCVCVCV